LDDSVSLLLCNRNVYWTTLYPYCYDIEMHRRSLQVVVACVYLQTFSLISQRWPAHAAAPVPDHAASNAAARRQCVARQIFAVSCILGS